MGRRKKSDIKLLDSEEASPEARGMRVKRIRNMANLTRGQMCDTSGININSLKGWEIGRYGGLTAHGAEKIIKRIAEEGVQCTLDWLMYGIGVQPTVQTNLIHNQLIQSHILLPQLTSDTNEDKKIIDELSLFKQHYDHAIYFLISDDSMTPLYYPGEYVAGSSFFGDQINTAIGLNCIIKMETGDSLVRELRKGSLPNTYTLVCVNTHTAFEKPILYDVKLTSAAPIIFQRKKCVLPSNT